MLGCDLSGGAILVGRSRQRELNDVISSTRLGLGHDLVHSLSLSLSLSLRICEPRNDLKVKQKLHSFSGSKALFYGQSK